MIKIAISIRENFFISPPPFWVYYSILGGGAQEVRQNSFARSATSLGVSLEMSIKVQSKNALNNKFSKNAYIFD